MQHNYKHYVYIIYDKQTNIPFYVGKGVCKRVFKHFLRAFTEPKTSLHYTILNMANNNNMPGVVLKWFASEEEAFMQERTLVGLFGRQIDNKAPLLNKTNGGQGGQGGSTSETAKRAALTRKQRGEWHSESSKHAIAEARKRFAATPEGRKTTAEAARRGQETARKNGSIEIRSEKFKQTMLEKKYAFGPPAPNYIKKGHVRGEEWRQHQSKVQKGKKRPPRSPEHCKALKEAAAKGLETRRKHKAEKSINNTITETL